MISARIICDSITEEGNRLTTFIVTYNRWIMAEIGTHRVLTKSSSSSRAISIHKMIERVKNTPAMPISFCKNQKGMSAQEDLDQASAESAKKVWLRAAQQAIDCAQELLLLGVHKQVTNRLLEPFMYAETIISGTEWGNFFNLRCHKDAQPEFQELAYCMLEAYIASTPLLVKAGGWHIPFGDKYLDEALSLPNRIKIAVARCARVSYLNFEGDIDHEKDYILHDELLRNSHNSPFEHVAYAMETKDCWIEDKWGNMFPKFSGNFFGWEQYRKTLPNENRKVFDPVELLKNRKVKK